MRLQDLPLRQGQDRGLTGTGNPFGSFIVSQLGLETKPESTVLFLSVIYFSIMPSGLFDPDWVCSTLTLGKFRETLIKNRGLTLSTRYLIPYCVQKGGCMFRSLD